MTRGLSRWSVLAACLSLMVVAAVSLRGQTPDPFVGTWKLNLGKSKFTPGPGPKAQTVTIRAVGDRFNVVSDTELPSGQKTHTEYTAGNDGKDAPMTGSAAIDTVAAKRIDARTVDREDKKAGKVVATLHAVLSADGKGMTVVQKGMNAAGQKVENTVVFDRQ
jgi:hypothetical protein